MAVSGFCFVFQVLEIYVCMVGLREGMLVA